MRCSTIGATLFAEEYKSHKVKDFVEEIENLSQIVEQYPNLRMLSSLNVVWGNGVT